MRLVRLEGVRASPQSGARQLVAAADRLEAEARVPPVRPVALERDQEREAVAGVERGVHGRLDHGAREATAAVLLERRDVVDLGHPVALEERAERAEPEDDLR